MSTVGQHGPWFDLGRPWGPMWSANERLHHYRRNDMAQQWRHGAKVLAKVQKMPGLIHGRPSSLQFYLPVPDKRRRDPHNFTGTVVKACIDGFVDAGVWPDDTAVYVRVMDPILVPHATSVVLDVLFRDVKGAS